MSDFTVADVLAWARTKPADEQYGYCDARNCAIAQFGRETGRAHLIGVGCLKHLGPLYEALNDDYEECTFGKLAVRLAALLPVKPVSDTWTKADAYLTDIEQVAG